MTKRAVAGADGHHRGRAIAHGKVADLHATSGYATSSRPSALGGPLDGGAGDATFRATG